MIDFKINAQPNDETCGATCLQAIYQYYGLNISLETVIKEVECALSGGTLSPLLGKHALKKGFEATIFVNNLTIFDPQWFENTLSSREIILTKLRDQSKFKQAQVFSHVSRAFQDFLELGGNLRFQTIDAEVLKGFLSKKIPILTGLNATYLYRCPRESFTSEGEAFIDDLKGNPSGHFVVLCGIDQKKGQIAVADPFALNPLSKESYYRVSISRMINAIMLGIVTYDANLLIIEPKKKGKA